MSTNILDIFKEVNNNIAKKIYKNDYESFFDEDNDIDTRISSFINIYNNNNLDSLEIISDLSSMYLFSPIESLYILIKKLLLVDILELSLRFTICSSIYSRNKEESFELFLILLKTATVNIENFNSTLYFDILKYLIHLENNKANEFKHEIN